MKGKKEPVKENKQSKKIGRPLKEVVPQSNNQPREIVTIKQPEITSREFTPESEPNDIFPEWPTDEEINNFDFGFNGTSVFKDNFSYSLPLSLISEGFNHVKWLRPEQFIKEFYLDEKLKKAYPNKNVIKLRTQIKLYFLNINNFKRRTSLGFSGNSVLDDLNVEKSVDDVFEETKFHIYKPYFQLLSSKIDLRVIDSYEREETEEEIKKRREEKEESEKIRLEQLKKDKKAVKPVVTKKIEEIKEEILKITIAKPSSISMAEKYPRFSKWLASLYQAIKDLSILDCNTGKIFYQKIYPQKNGVPIYNSSGRYWVKLYHMGKYRKIEIDDTMPCGKYDEMLLPKCQNLEELWPCLISKALIKMFSYKYKTKNITMWEDVGDVSFITALTGYIGEKLLTKNEELSPIFDNILCDENFKSKQKYLLGYHPIIEKIVINEHEEKLFTTKNMSDLNVNKYKFNDKLKRSSTILKKSRISQSNLPNIVANQNQALQTTLPKTIIEDEKDREKSSIKEKSPEKSVEIKERIIKPHKDVKDFRKSDSKLIQIDVKFEHYTNEKYKNILTNFAYSIIETFKNETFNMKRTQMLDFSDLKMKIQQAKVNYKELTREEKKNYIHGIMELKAKQKEEKNRRIEELKLPGKSIHLIKVKNDSYKAPELNFIVEYENEQIEMAKKCILSKWEFPPSNFFDLHFERKHSKFPDLYDEFLKLPNKPQSSNHSWNKETYMQLISNEQFLNDQNPLKKFDGAWLEYQEFLTLFNKFIILHNPKLYKTQLKLDNNWYNFNTDVYEPNLDYQVIYLLPISNISSDYINYNNKINKQNSSLLILFEPNVDKLLRLNDNNLYLIFDLIDGQGNIIIQDYILTSFYFSTQIDVLSPAKEYFIIFKSIICPFGYHLSLYSDHGIETLSNNQYLKKFRNYYSYPLKIDHTPMEKNKYFLLMRVSFKVNQPSKLNYIIKYNDKFIKQCIELLLINKDKKMRIFPVDYITIQPSDANYFILMQITPPFTCPEGSVEIEFFSDNPSLNFDVIQHVDTYEVYDKYIPNKHGIIFKELIYSAEVVYSTLYIKLRREKTTKVVLQSVDPKKKDTKENVSTLVESIDIEDKVRIILELYKNNKLLFTTDNYNTFIIPNQIFEGIPVVIPDPKSKVPVQNQNLPQNIPYILICRLDLSEAPQWLLKPETTSDIGWVIRVISSDTLGFLKDTSKEDSERALKESWEIAEIGRADKARKARTKFLLSVRKQKGEVLQPEEEKLLNEIRERKTTLNQNQPIVEEPVKKVDPKKNTKPDPKKKEVKEVIEPPIQPIILLDMNKPCPKVESHMSSFIKEYLVYCYKDRDIIKNNHLDLEKKQIMSPELKEEIRDKILIEFQENEKIRSKETDEYTSFKTSLHEGLKSLLKETIQTRKHQKIEKDEILRERDALKGKQNIRREKEKILQDIISEVSDLSQSVTSYLEIIQSGFQSEFLEKAFLVINARKEDQYRNDIKKFTTKDKQNALKILDEIKTLGFKINDEITKKLSDIAGV